MIKLVILEGARCGGKSGVARKLRENMKSSTLINFTGFPEDGDEGLQKTKAYYEAFIDMLMSLSKSNADYTFICDRFFFSEAVFSRLFKRYYFTNTFEKFLIYLNACPNLTVDLFYLTFSESVLDSRLKREKSDYFAKTDNKEDIMAQQAEYSRMLDFVSRFDREYGNGTINIYEVDTSSHTVQDTYEWVLERVNQ